MNITPQFPLKIYIALAIITLLPATILAQEVDTIVDIRDGQRYGVVKIGNQWWTAENLKAAKYLNNDPVPTGLTNLEWGNTNAGAYAIYPHGSITGLESDAEVLEAYGALYNGYAVVDNRGLCPMGWKVPSDEEWTILTDYVGGLSVAGGKLKSTRTAPDVHPRWESPNTGATDEYGFTALPGGTREWEGGFNNIGYNGYWWASSETNSDFAWFWSVIASESSVNWHNTNKTWGYSVRCHRVGQFAYLTISSENFEPVGSHEFTNENATQKLYLINQGVEAVDISNISLSTVYFSVDLTPTTLAAGDSVHFTVSFSATQPGEYTDQLVIESNDPYQPSISIPINGFIATTACGVISENTTWTKANSPYHLQDCNVAVGAGVTLTIEPGVTVIIDPTRQISVDGTLIANGAEGDSITFRDNAGNGFSRLYFRSGSNVEMSYFSISGAETAIHSESNELSLTHGRITGGVTGVNLSYVLANIENLKVTNCQGNAINANNTELILKNSTLNNNYRAIIIVNTSGRIEGCNISNNISTEGVSGLYAGNVVNNLEIIGNSFSNNTPYALEVGGIVKDGSVITTQIRDNIFDSNAYSAMVTDTYFSNNYIENSSFLALYAQNSTVINNTINNNAGNGINANNSTLTNNTITNNGGIGISASGYNEISYSTISGNTGDGIREEGGSNIQHCDIIDNGGDGIWTSALTTVNYSNIHGNTGYNYRATKEGSETIDATNNYWGTTSTSEIAAKIYDYYDDGVTVIVNYDPYSEQPVKYPRIIGTSVSDITFTSAIINATVNPNTQETNVYIEYGLTSEYGTTLPTTPATLTGSDNQTATLQLSDLTLGTKYHFRIKAVNTTGTSYSDPHTFTTAFHYMTDIRDGQRYRVVKIGDQWWTAENLKAAKYLNNDPIPTGYSDGDWANLETGAYAIYPHSQIDGLNSNAEVLEAYGALYNWFAVVDSRGLCPIGWKVPSDGEWTILTDYAGGESVAGGKLKSTRTAPDAHPRWESPNGGATDEYEFSSLPGGRRYYDDGIFGSVGGVGHWWSSAEDDTGYAWGQDVGYDNGDVGRSNGDKRLGFSVRCVRDIDLSGSFAYLIISSENFEPISSLEFTNENASQKLYLINQGGETVTISSITLSTPEFSVDLEPLTLAAGDSIHFTVNFTATEYGVYEGNLQIESNDPFVSTINIALQGEMKYYSPMAVVQPATEVTYTSAKLNAKVNSYGEVAQVWFQYGLSETDFSSWQTVVATPGNISGTSEVGVSSNISSLLINTTYYFRVKVVNDYETVFSTTASFTTLSKAPTVTTQSVSNNSSTQATLNGLVNPHNSSTTVVFKYGITETITDDWLVVNYGETLNGYDALQVSIDITGLSNQTQYYYLVEGTSSAGTSTGEIIGFNTSAPIVNLTAADEITTTSARLNATVNGNGYSSSYYFEYASNESLSDSQVTATQNLDAGTEAVAVSANIANLDPNTIYYFRILAENTYGTGYSNPGNLHTLCDWDIICTQPLGIETLCQGDNISEHTTTSTNANSFQWRVDPTIAGEISGAGTTTTIIWDNSYHGLARIYVSGYNGVCNSIESEPLEVMVNPKPENKTIGGDGEVCPGSQGNPYSVSMVDGNSYLWTLTGGTIAQGQNTNSVRVNWLSETGTNNIEVTETVSATGCNKKHLKTVLVSGALAPPKPDIRVKGAIQILISSVNASSYQWYVNNSPIESAVKKYYVPRGSTGEHSLQIIEGNCHTFSDPLVVPVDLSKTEVEKLMWAFPNPSKGLVYVELIGELNGLVHFRVLDIKGAEIYLKKAYKGEYYHIETLQITNSQPGLYIIESRIGGVLVDYQKVVIE